LLQDVNPKNFLNVITGNAKAMKGIGSGKVLKRYRVKCSRKLKTKLI
jgi:hypothetical protein